MGVSRQGEYSAPISVLITYVFTFYNSIISKPTEKSRKILEGSVHSVENWSSKSSSYGANIIYESNQFRITLYSVSYSSAYQDYAQRLLYKIE